MNRIKNFDATGIAPNGYLYSGDLNAIQDAAAAQIDFGQTISTGALAIGESGLQLLHYGSGEARVSGLLRTDGIFRGLGGIYAGAFTTAQRGSIALGSRPYGLVITNSTTNQLEWNSNTDAAPTWYSIASDGAGYVNTTNGITFGGDTTLHRTAAATVQLGTASQAGTLQIGSTAQPGLLTMYGQTSTGIRLQFFNGTDTQPTFTQLTNGTHNWGPGGATGVDTSAARTAPGVLTFTNVVNAITGFQVNGTALAASHLSNGVTGTGAIALANAPAFTASPTAPTPATVDNSTKLATTAWVIAQGYVATTGIAVSSVFGRTGAITAQIGDYTAAQVTNAADKSAAGAQVFTGNIGTGGAPTVVGGAAGTTMVPAGGIIISAPAATNVISATVAGDTVYRFRVDNNGLHSWSAGATVTDTTMYRSGAGILTVTNYVNAVNGFQINGVALAASHLSNGVTGSGAIALAGSPTFTGTVTAPTINATTAFQRSGVALAASHLSNGVTGSGAVVLATSPTVSGTMNSANIVGTGTIQTSSYFIATETTVPAWAYTASVSGEAQPRFIIQNDGTLNWGPGGSIATDTTLFRSSARNLRTDGAFWARDGIVVDAGGTGSPLYIGSALDTYMYRSSASTLTLNGWLISSAGIYSSSPAAGIGYYVGSGAAVTCAANSSVACARMSGTITGSAAIPAATVVMYTVTSSPCAAIDGVIVTLQNGATTTSGGGRPNLVAVTRVAAGTFTFVFENDTPSAMTPVFNFQIIKGANS